METLVGKGLNDLANLVSTKWYAGMGLVGLVIFMWVLLKGTPHDDILIAAIAITMFGFGFAEAEIRTTRQHINQSENWMVTEPIRKMTGPGFLLYCIGLGGIITFCIRTYQLA